MNRLQELNRKSYFTLDDVVQNFDITPLSARVWCSRQVRQGMLVRLKNGFYVTVWKWENLSRPEFFRIANIMQVPSYISLMTALTYYEVTTQAQKNFYESVCQKRSIVYDVSDAIFSFIKMQPPYYGELVKTDGFFIATKEKAFLDATYLYSFGKYRFDLDSLDLKKLDMMKLKSLSEKYPAKTKETLKRLCGI